MSGILESGEAMSKAHYEIHQLFEELTALRECLIQTGVIRQEQLEVQLHRRRFETVRRSSWWSPSGHAGLKEVLYLRDLSSDIIGWVGDPALYTLALVSKTVSTAVHEQMSAVYLFGGLGPPNEPVHCVERFHPRTGTWDILTHKMPLRAWNPIAAVLEGQIHLAVIGLDQSEGLVVRFDPCLGSRHAWTVLGRSQGIQTPRVHAASGVVAGKLYVCGGQLPDSSQDLDSVERFDLKVDGMWEVLPPMSAARVNAACAAFGEQLLVCGGHQGGPHWMFTITNSSELFDPTLGQWGLAPPMIVDRAGHCAARVGSCVYVCGGFGADSFPQALNSAEFLQPGSCVWASLKPMQDVRAGASCAVVGSYIYTFGGVKANPFFMPNSNVHLSSVERYDPERCEWELQASMPEPRACHAAAVLRGCIY